MKKLLSVAALGGLLVGCGSLPADTPVKTSSDVITIGGIAALSGLGGDYGIPVERTASILLEDLNNNGGINGKKLEIIWEDSKCEPKNSSLGAQKLINVDKVNIIYGFACSGAALGAIPIAEKNDVLMMVSTASSGEIAKSGEYVFKTSPSDGGAGKIIANYANDQGYKTVGVLSAANDYAIALANTFENVYTGEVLREDYVPAQTDFKSVITKMKQSNPDAVYINPNGMNQVSIIARQMDELQWNVPILMNEVAMGALDDMKKYPDLFKPGEVMGANYEVEETNEFVSFLQKYEEIYGEKSSYPAYIASSINGFNALIWAMQNAEDPLNTTELKRLLDERDSFDGIVGDFIFDETGQADVYHIPVIFNGEQFVPVNK